MLFRFLLTMALTAVWAPQLRADVSVRVCNTGQLNVDAAVAYEEHGFISSDWAISGWHNVKAGDCVNVYHHPTACQDLATHQNVYNQWNPCARVYVAYWFQDSTGVWGAANFQDKDWSPRGEKICVSQAGMGIRSPTPDARCTKPGWFLIPVNAKAEPRGGNVYREFSGGAYPGYTVNVALTTRDRAIPLGPGGGPAPPASSQGPSSDGGAALREAAGLGAAAIIAGLIINEIVEQSKCNTPIPKPFEPGTLNAESLRAPVVRRTCERADWYLMGVGRRETMTLQRFLGTDSRSVGSVLDPPQQVDKPGTADSAADPQVRQIVAVLDNFLGSRGGTNVTNYGKFRYKGVGERIDEVWVNLIALDLPRAKIGSQSGVSVMTVPCVNDYDCALHLVRREGYAKALPSVTLYLQGPGSWQAVLAEMNKLKAIFPKQPIIQAK